MKKPNPKVKIQRKNNRTLIITNDYDFCWNKIKELEITDFILKINNETYDINETNFTQIFNNRFNNIPCSIR